MNVTSGVQKLIAGKNREYRANKNSNLIFKINNFHPVQSNPRINASKLKHAIVTPKINLTPSLICCFRTRGIQLLVRHNQPKFDMYVTTSVQKLIAAKNREYRANKNSNLIFSKQFPSFPKQSKDKCIETEAYNSNTQNKSYPFIDLLLSYS